MPTSAYASGSQAGFIANLIDFLVSPDGSLWALFAASSRRRSCPAVPKRRFLRLKLYPELYWPALLIATVGNTLGGLSSYLIGRLLPQRGQLKGLAQVQRHGSAALLFAWAPVIGDALCVAAGWLRLHWLPVTLFMAIGKFVRYWVIAEAAQIAL